MSAPFTLQDVSGILLSFAVLSSLLLAPGYVLASALDLFEFATQSLPFRLAISVCISVATAPSGVYLLWRFLPNLVLPAVASVCLIAPVFIFKIRPKTPGLSSQKGRRAIGMVIVAWIFLGSFLLSDLQIGHRLYFPLISYDYALRTAFTSSIARTGVPPTNPYFFPGYPCPLRYHYFWYMLCALAVRLTGGWLSPRVAVAAGTLWSGVALIAILAVYQQRSAQNRAAGLNRRVWITICFLAVSGLDLLPLIAIFLFTHLWNASSEWWNELVLSWSNSVLWQPHSVAALVSCITATLLLRSAPEAGWRRAAVIVLCGAAMAGAIGLSIYVAFVFLVFLPVWGVWLVARGNRSTALDIAASLLCTAVLACPYLLEIFRGVATGGTPIALTIRSFYFAEALAHAVAPNHPFVVPLLNLLFLPLNYFMELGIFFVAGLLYVRSLKKAAQLDEQDAFESILLLVSLAISSFLRSETITLNDLGWRAIIAAQFVLLVWAVRLYDRQTLQLRVGTFVVRCLLTLGAAATVYDLAMIRVYPLFLDNLNIPRYHWLAPDHKLGERTLALRRIYSTLGRQLPESARVQQNPDTVPQDLFFGLYGNRATVVDMPTCGVSFGGSARLCAELYPQVASLFQAHSPATIAKLDFLCNRLSIDAIVVKDTDPAWNDPDSWIWKRTPQLQTPYARAYICGTEASASGPAGAIP